MEHTELFFVVYSWVATWFSFKFSRQGYRIAGRVFGAAALLSLCCVLFDWSLSWKVLTALATVAAISIYLGTYALLRTSKT